MRLPIRGTELVGDEAVRRVRIGDAQQGLGQAHQHDAFARRQVVLAQQRIDAARVLLAAADRVDERVCLGAHSRPLLCGQCCALEQRLERLRLVGEVVVGDRGVDQRRRGVSRVEQPTARGRVVRAGHAP